MICKTFNSLDFSNTWCFSWYFAKWHEKKLCDGSVQVWDSFVVW